MNVTGRRAFSPATTRRETIMARRQSTVRETSVAHERTAKILDRTATRLRRISKKRSGSEMKSAYREAAEKIGNLIDEVNRSPGSRRARR